MAFADLTGRLSGIAFSVFAEPAIVASVTVAGLFTESVKDGEHIEANSPVGTSFATLEIQPDSLPASVSIGDSVTVRGQTYSIVDITHDACGNTKLILHR